MAVRVKAVGVRTKQKVVEKDNWDKISNDYDKACMMSCRPGDDFRKVKVGDVIDEEKSVRWNREEVERLRLAYDEEVKRLNCEKNAAIVAVTDRAVKLIAYEADISEEKARLVWDFVYKRGHAYGEMFNMLDDYIGLAEKLSH